MNVRNKWETNFEQPVLRKNEFLLQHNMSFIV